MDKKNFIKLFKDYDEYMVSSLWNDIELAEKLEMPIFTGEFYPPLIWDTLEKQNINGLSFAAKGLNETAEKRVIMIYPKDYDISYMEFPITYFQIDGQNKFRELFHKDFLGTIMSLGVKREIMGDLIVKNSLCFGVILGEKYDIIEEGITKIGNVPVKLKIVDEKQIPEGEFEDKKFLISSLRLDGLISGITGLSRQKSVDEILKGNILLNYKTIRDKSTEVKEGDIFTIKKIGKFKFDSVEGNSRKNKIRINVKKFI